MNKLRMTLFIAIFLISLSSLITELSLIRVFDVLFYPNIAYMIITCALFGYGLAGVYSVMKPKVFEQNIQYEMGRLSIILSISIAVILPLMNTLPFNFNDFNTEPLKQIAYFACMYISIVLPFFISGRIFTILFTEYAKQIQVLYFWDLIGAAFGSIIVIPVIPLMGPGGLLLIAASLSIIASALFIRRKKWSSVTAIVSIILIIVPILYSPQYIDFIEHQGKRGVKLAREQGKIEATIWDPISKIDVINYESFRFISYDGGSQNSVFYPFDGNYQSLREKLSNELTTHFWQRGVLVSHYVKEGTSPNVFVIGSAGGQEIKAALLYGAGHVDAIEMVGAVVELGGNEYSQYIGNLFNHPSVSVYVGEGRSFLRASQDKYDIIQIFSNHTSSSIAAGTGAVATNYLQTSDAYAEYFSHLTENGILHINHYYYPKMITTAALAWTQMGRTDFYKNVIVYDYDKDETLPTLLIKMQPWTPSELSKVKQFFSAKFQGDDGNYSIVADPLHPEQNSLPIEYFSGKLSPETIALTNARIEPSTDDRPYFNFLYKSFNPFPDGFKQFLQNPFGSIQLGVLTLFITFIVALLYATVFIIFPLSFSSTSKQKWPYRSINLLYFSCLGAGFIIIEFVFIQLFMRLIGSPLYTYSSVLFTLLLGAGVGSIMSNRFKLSPQMGWYMPFLGIFISIAILLLVYPYISNYTLSLPIIARIGISFILMFPVGFFLGMPFPLGILSLQDKPKGAIAWAWGMNGLFTVIGGLLGVVLSIQWGFTKTLLIACSLYIFALVNYYFIRSKT